MAGSIASSQTSRWNAALWFMSVALLAGSGISYWHLNQVSPTARTLISLSLFLAAFSTFLYTHMGSQLRMYWTGAVEETRKVVWPTQQETLQTTLAVLVMLSLMGILLWTVDAMLLRLVGMLTLRAGG